MRDVQVSLLMSDGQYQKMICSYRLFENIGSSLQTVLDSPRLNAVACSRGTNSVRGVTDQTVSGCVRPLHWLAELETRVALVCRRLKTQGRHVRQ
jgi:hypothetical protein